MKHYLRLELSILKENKMRVAIVMGSDSDYDVVKGAVEVLKENGVDVTVRVLSAHRTPNQTHEFVTEMNQQADLFIAAAGKAAHLAGVVASLTTKPVIGLPIKSSTMDGMDSLLSTVQMPSGIPVATVAINGAKNAGILAMQILALKYETLQDRLKEMKIEMEKAVLKKDEKISKMI